MEEGTLLTLEWAEEYQRPFFHIELKDSYLPEEARLSRVISWLETTPVGILNVAGNRESTSPGIAEATSYILQKLFRINSLMRKGL